MTNWKQSGSHLEPMKEVMNVTEPNTSSCAYCHSERPCFLPRQKTEPKRGQRSWGKTVYCLPGCLRPNPVFLTLLCGPKLSCPRSAGDSLGALESSVSMLHSVPTTKNVVNGCQPDPDIPVSPHFPTQSKSCLQNSCDLDHGPRRVIASPEPTLFISQFRAVASGP